MKREITINSKQSFADAILDIGALWAEHGYLTIRIDTGMQRTIKQNKALHKYCQMLADALNAAGYDQRKMLKPGIEIPWTMEAVKRELWKPVQDAVIGKESTADADRDEYNKVYEVLNKHLGAKLGVHVPWPQKADIEA